MEKKGFTLVELMVVIVILAVLALIAVPVYTGVRENVSESVYESKIEEILSKSEQYAEETGKVVFDVKSLIENGQLSADNEQGEYKDPRDGRDMGCDIINITYENGSYQGKINQNEDKCYSEEELENLYGMIELYVVDASENEIAQSNEWMKQQKIKVKYRFKEEYQHLEANIKEIFWTGGEEKICEKDTLKDCESYEIETTSVRNVLTNITIHVQLDISGGELISSASKEVKLDIEKPTVLAGSIVIDNDVDISSKRKVEFELSDGSGSGVKEYSLVTTKTCHGASYKSASDGIQTEYLNDGTYYICVKDKVGNETEDSDLDKTENQIQVSNVVTGTPTIKNARIESRNASYNTNRVNIIIEAYNGSNTTTGLRMCISKTGFLNGCSWQNYTNRIDNYLLTDREDIYDGVNRKIYVSIQDSAGNVVSREANYTVYSYCQQKNPSKVYTDADYGSCSVLCGGGVQYRRYKIVDKYFSGYTCSTGQDRRTCNNQDCCSKTEISSYGSWSSCSASCGSGTKTRTEYRVSSYDGRSCPSTTQSKSCSSSCSSSDGGGGGGGGGTSCCDYSTGTVDCCGAGGCSGPGC